MSGFATMAGVALILGGLLTQSAEARMYRWVDENGEVHFSDKLPPKAARLQREKIDERGAVLERMPAQKTEAQIEAERAARRSEQQDRERAAAQAELDRVLLQSYGSVRDLEKARDSRITTLDGYIRVSEHAIENLQKQLEQQQRQAAAAERQGKPVPEEVVRDLAETRGQIENHERKIAENRAQQEAIRKEFAANIARFKELAERRGGG